MVPGTGKKGVSISKPEEDPVAVAAQFQYWANRSRYFWTLERQKKEAQQDSPLPQAMPANSFLLSYVDPRIDVKMGGAIKRFRKKLLAALSRVTAAIALILRSRRN